MPDASPALQEGLHCGLPGHTCCAIGDPGARHKELSPEPARGSWRRATPGPLTAAAPLSQQAAGGREVRCHPNRAPSSAAGTSNLCFHRGEERCPRLPSRPEGRRAMGQGFTRA